MQQIKEQDFDAEVIKSTIPVVVDFAAEWCPPCRSMLPILKELSENLAGKVKFVKVDIDESPNISKKYSVMSIPTMILFKDGSQIGAMIGGQPKAKVTEWINSGI